MVETTQWVEYSGHDQSMWGQEYPENVQIMVAPSNMHQPLDMAHHRMQAGHQPQPMDMKKQTVQERSTRRKQATQREKRRMEKLNHCIEDIRAMVCPNMKTPTKAKVLREAINRINYLERITAELMEKKDQKHIQVFEGAMNPPTTLPLVQPAQPQVIMSQTYSPEANQAYSPDVAHSYSPEGQDYSPDTTQSYSPEPHLPPVEILQMSDESNSGVFEGNGDFYLQVQSDQPDQEGIQLFDEAAFNGHAYYHDATIPYKYE